MITTFDTMVCIHCEIQGHIPPWQKEEQQEQGEQDDNNEDAEEVSSAPAATSVVDMPAITADDLD